MGSETRHDTTRPIARLEEAEPGDLPAVLDLLRLAELPTEGVALHFGAFLVARDREGAVCGAVGLERYGGDGLLRSLVVGPDHRRRGLGGALCDEVERRAAALGIGELYLLTLDADELFRGRGYRTIDRAVAPPSIRSTQELSDLCPDEAILMRKSLEPVDGAGGGR